MSFPLLHLASPMMRDGHGVLAGKHSVRDAQWLMSGNGVYKIHTYRGQLDGQYGTATSVAARRAKYWLGYTDLHPTFGGTLYRYLLPKTNPLHVALPPDYLTRRKNRLAAAKVSPKLAALAMARSKIGAPYPWGHEYPSGSNSCVYSQWWGYRGPWCLMFVDYCLAHSGRAWGFSRSDGTAYVPEIVSRARYGRFGLHLTSTPQPGDLVTYTLHGEVNAHIGFFERFVGNDVVSVDGNTLDATHDANGGYVLRRQRSRSSVAHFIRIE